MADYTPSKEDDAFEQWWYAIYIDKPSMRDRQCFEAGYQAGQTAMTISAVLAAALVVAMIFVSSFLL